MLQAGDIALLAPSGNDLWRYEEALEARGIPVSTQAGKGFFRRQEIQDLIALTRVLADPRDTLALGALLRGPVVGLTDEELLDLVDGLPRAPERPDARQKLRLGIDVAHVAHPVAREVIGYLQVLARRALGTTPHDILSQAVDAIRLRPVIRQRHDGYAERALANVDLFLEMSRPYAVRGLRAFARTMKAAWDGRTRTVEGRPDAQEEAVSLFTMHASKGLEWPVVIPINTATRTKAVSGALVDRRQIVCTVRSSGSARLATRTHWTANAARSETSGCASGTSLPRGPGRPSCCRASAIRPTSPPGRRSSPSASIQSRPSTWNTSRSGRWRP